MTGIPSFLSLAPLARFPGAWLFEIGAVLRPTHSRFPASSLILPPIGWWLAESVKRQPRMTTFHTFARPANSGKVHTFNEITK